MQSSLKIYVEQLGVRFITVIRSVLGHGAEIWAINKSADKTPMTFEKKILTKFL
jgi:hypothetical protein